MPTAITGRAAHVMLWCSLSRLLCMAPPGEAAMLHGSSTWQATYMCRQTQLMERNSAGSCTDGAAHADVAQSMGTWQRSHVEPPRPFRTSAAPTEHWGLFGPHLEGSHGRCSSQHVAGALGLDGRNTHCSPTRFQLHISGTAPRQSSLHRAHLAWRISQGCLPLLV